MNLVVLIPFRFRGAMAVRGQQIEADRPEAARLLFAGVVRMATRPERAVAPPPERPRPAGLFEVERAVIAPEETAKRPRGRPRKKQEE